jgi:hypothetical protein
MDQHGTQVSSIGTEGTVDAGTYFDQQERTLRKKQEISARMVELGFDMLTTKQAIHEKTAHACD